MQGQEQLLASVIAQSAGDGHLHNINSIMFSVNNVAAFICSYVLAISIGSPILVHMLDKATAQQCINHDWPTAAHKVHMDWCTANGYVTK